MSSTSSFQSQSDLKGQRRRKVFCGQRKTFFEGIDPSTYICHFTDEKSVNGPSIAGKGVMNNRISEMLFSKLSDMSIPHHFIKRLNMREQILRATDPFLFTVRLHNYVDHSLHERFGIEKGTRLPRMLTEYTTKGGVYHLLSKEHILSFGWANEMELDEVQALATRINDILCGFFMGIGLRLVRLNLEFGRIFSQEFMEPCDILLIDELSPDTFELQDLQTGESLSLNTDEKDLATAAATYQHIADRFGVLHAVNHSLS